MTIATGQSITSSAAMRASPTTRTAGLSHGPDPPAGVFRAAAPSVAEPRAAASGRSPGGHPPALLDRRGGSAAPLSALPAPAARLACAILCDSTPANIVTFSARASAEYVCVVHDRCANGEGPMSLLDVSSTRRP